MAPLPTAAMDQLQAEIMREFSAVRELIPIKKPQLRQLLELMDTELETAEVSIVQAIPASPAKTWLLDNQPIGRELIKRIVEARKAAL